MHLKASQNTFLAGFNLICWFSGVFSKFSPKNIEKRLKKCFDQLLGVRSTQKLVEIYNSGLPSKWQVFASEVKSFMIALKLQV